MGGNMYECEAMMNKLIACVVKPYEITLESGRKILVDNERWVGYITEDDDDGYFRGAEFALEEDGWEDCGYLKLSREYFESHVQSWKEVEF